MKEVKEWVLEGLSVGVEMGFWFVLGLSIVVLGVGFYWVVYGILVFLGLGLEFGGKYSYLTADRKSKGSVS